MSATARSLRSTGPAPVTPKSKSRGSGENLPKKKAKNKTGKDPDAFITQGDLTTRLDDLKDDLKKTAPSATRGSRRSPPSRSMTRTPVTAPPALNLLTKTSCPAKPPTRGLYRPSRASTPRRAPRDPRRAPRNPRQRLHPGVPRQQRRSPADGCCPVWVVSDPPCDVRTCAWVASGNSHVL